LVSLGAFSGSAPGQTCWVTETDSSKASVPQIRVVALVVMVGTRLGDCGGEGTLKSRLQTTPNGHRFGSAFGHPPVAGAGEVVEVAPVAVLVVVPPLVIVWASWAFP
jgi:hypothetical protein